MCNANQERDTTKIHVEKCCCLAFVLVLNSLPVLSQEGYQGIKEAFGIYGQGRNIRMPSTNALDTSVWGGNDPGLEYANEWQNIMGYEIPVKLLYPTYTNAASWETILTNFQDDLDSGQDYRLMLRSHLLADDSTNALANAAYNGVEDGQLSAIGDVFALFPNYVLDRVILNPNWEYTGGWFKDAINYPNLGPTAFPEDRVLAYRDYWRRFHGIIAGKLSAAGKHNIQWSLEFAGGAFSVNYGEDQEAIIQGIIDSYPGDAYVDSLGCSLYGISTNVNDIDAVLDFVSAFAEDHGLGTGIGELGIWYEPDQPHLPNDGDCPEFYEKVFAWMGNESVAGRLSHVVLFDVDASENAQHSVLFFDTRNFKLNLDEGYPFVQSGFGDKWSNRPECRRTILDQLTISYFQGFSSVPSDWLSIAGTWFVTNGICRQTEVSSSSRKYVVYNGATYRNVDFQADCTFRWGDGVVLREQNGSYYSFYLDKGRSPNAAVFAYCNGSSLTDLQVWQVSLSAGQTYTLRVRAEGARFDCTLEDACLGAVQDSALASGRVGFFSRYKQSPEFDNATVRRIFSGGTN